MDDTLQWSLTLEQSQLLLGTISIMFIILGMACLCCSFYCASNPTKNYERNLPNPRASTKLRGQSVRGQIPCVKPKRESFREGSIREWI